MSAIARLARSIVRAEPPTQTTDAPPIAAGVDAVEDLLHAVFDRARHRFVDVDQARLVLLAVREPTRAKARRVLDAIASARSTLGRAPSALEIAAELSSDPVEDQSGSRQRFG